MKILLILFLTCLSVTAKTNTLYTVIVGDVKNPIFKSTNCISVNLHTNNCYLIKYIENNKTNEFHAWMTPISVMNNK